MIPGNANPLLLATAADSAAAAANITKSLRFNGNGNDDSYLERSVSSASNRRTFTFAAWVKNDVKTSNHDRIFSAGTSSSDVFDITLSADSEGTHLRIFNKTSGSVNTNWNTVNKFRDAAAWFHVVCAVDTTQATNTERVKVYINGTHITQNGTTNTLPSQNADLAVNSATTHYIGRSGPFTDGWLAGYLTDIYFIDGSQLEPTSFGAYDDNGVWQAIGYSGTYGTNGFHLLDFANEATVGHDSSGNENDFSATNISTSGTDSDILFDVPTNGTQSDTGAGGEVSGNYCTWNPIAEYNPSPTFSNGNLEFTASGDWNIARGTIAVKTGKYYAEFTTVGATMLGIETDVADAGRPYFNNSVGCIALRSNGQVFIDNVAQTTLGGWSDGNVIGMALDLDGGSFVVTKDGSAYTTISIPSNSYWDDKDVFYSATALAGGNTVTANWGQRAFSNSAPSNHKALCTTNLPTPTIADGSDYFETVTWTGTGASKSLTTGFSPDFIWLKNRAISSNHRIFDSVRGQGVMLHTNTTNNDQSDTNNLTSFDSNGFTVGTNSNTNGSGNGIVAWTWDAGSSTASNTDGSITSSVRANQTAGFSIVTYSVPSSGTTFSVGHGLGAAPSLIIAKDRDGSNPWGIYHSALGVGKGLVFSTAAEQVNSNWWNNTNPTSTLFYLNTGIYAHSEPGKDYVAYCFAEVAGHSAFGSYTGNGSASNGPFIYTGFKVAFLITKRTDSSTSGDWNMVDTTRGTHNPVGPYLYANQASAEGDVTIYDLLSNGFKIRESGAGTNNNGSTYVYFAFAENPFQANGGLAR